MYKFFLTAAFVVGLSGSAFAFQDESHNGKTVAVPGATKSAGVFAPAVQVTPHGMVVTAPPGANVDIDNDDGDLQIDIARPGKPRGLLGLGFLGM